MLIVGLLFLLAVCVGIGRFLRATDSTERRFQNEAARKFGSRE